jgi:hypothetical protein
MKIGEAALIFGPLNSAVKFVHYFVTKYGLGYSLGEIFTNSSGADFWYIFFAENPFPRKIPRNFLEKRVFVTFSAENSIFSQHFLGKIFREIFRGIFPGKNVRKIGPWSSPWFACAANEIFGQGLKTEARN